PRKIANLCQALQNHLAIGYKLIVVQEAPRNSRGPRPGGAGAGRGRQGQG
ncbi:hypothetical protein I5G56_28855, partial [Pseudomonas aeruginosa]|nr:hypothetical protein [Pseudomonas aeruginosa]